MNMNILEQEDLIKGATDDILLQEAKSPTGRVPQFLVISEIQRRKSMRDRFSAQDGQPEQSVAEQIVAGAAPQGIGALQPPPQMPPQAPVMAMPPPQMPPEMMAAQMPPMPPPPQMMAAGGGRMPYRRMADGGVIPPNALVEDASKFNPESLYDVGPMEQSAMANATNMGIASVLPMAGGGVVKMGLGGYLTAKEGWVPDRYQDEGKGIGSLDYSQIGSDALTGAELAALAMMVAPEPATTAAGAVLKAGTTAVRAVPRGIQFAKTIPGRVKALPDQARAYLARENVAKHQLGKRLAALLGLGVIEGSPGGVISRLGNGPEVGDVIRVAEAIEAENNNEPVLATKDEAENFLFPKNALYQGGIVKMRAGETVPFLSINDVRASLAEQYMKPPEWLNNVEGDVLTQEQALSLQDYTSQFQEIDLSLAPKRKDVEQGEKDPNIILAPEVPVLETRNVGSKNISRLLNQDQGTELKTARELLREQLNQEVEPYDPTELLLKSQERSDKRALSEALIALGAGISRGDIASGFEGAGKSVAGIRNKQEALQQELEVRRGEAQTQSQKDKIARDIQIAQADISTIESNEGRKDKLIGRQIQYEALLQDAERNNNTASINQFTAELAANKFVRSQFEFDEQIAANFSKQEQLNFRAKLDFMKVSFQDTYKQIVDRGLYPEKGEPVKTSSEIQKEVEAARKRMFDSLDSLKEQGENYNPTKKERDYKAAGFTTN